MVDNLCIDKYLAGTVTLHYLDTNHHCIMATCFLTFAQLNALIDLLFENMVLCHTVLQQMMQQTLHLSHGCIAADLWRDPVAVT